MTPIAIPALPAGAGEAWLFPGQGAQHVGMGKDLHAEIAAARAVFEAADEALGFPLSALCFEGPEDELLRTVNAQPALVAHGVAALAAAIDRGSVAEGPAFLAGHSLGEYAALIAAGAIGFEDGIRLVRERGRLMQAACDARPGAMAAVLGLERERVEALCAEHGASLCNENAPGNVSIGGPPAAVGAAAEAARAAGASRVVPLKVAGAFHTPLMASAAEGMAEALAGVRFADPRAPVISNVTARPLTAGSELAGELRAQITSPVLWAASLRTMLGAGAASFTEFGPGRVLTGTVGRTDRSAAVRNVATAADARGERGDGAA